MSDLNIKEVIENLRNHIDNTEKAKDLIKENNLEKILEYFYSLNEYNEFLDKYPALFQLSLKKDFDYSLLNTLLNMTNNINNKVIDSKNADIEVGEIMADKFKPNWRNSK